MSQYNRMICYLYHFENGQKMENVGFARVEEKGDYCRIFIRVKNVEGETKPDAYLVWSDFGRMKGIKIGTMKIHNEGMECKCQWKLKKLEEEKCQISEMDGLAICQSGRAKYVTIWHDVQMDTEHFQAVSVEERMQQVEAEDLRREEEKREENAEKEEEGKHKNFEEANNFEKKESVEKLEENAVEKTEVLEDSICHNCPVKRKNLDYGEKMLSMFTSMSPFRTPEVKRCVRLELQDIGCFPVKAWALANNAFVLRGYCCYRHLLFAETRDYGYVLGVPGIYTKKDKELAEKFGFTLFQQIGTESNISGAFGYFMMQMAEYLSVNEYSREKCLD